MGPWVLLRCARKVSGIIHNLYAFLDIAMLKQPLLVDRTSPHPGQAISLQFTLDGAELRVPENTASSYA
jgi:hypothetical protein